MLLEKAQINHGNHNQSHPSMQNQSSQTEDSYHSLKILDETKALLDDVDEQIRVKDKVRQGAIHGDEKLPMKNNEDEVRLHWMNHYLNKIGFQAANMDKDVADGFFLCVLIDFITGNKPGDYHCRIMPNEAIENQAYIDENLQLLSRWITQDITHQSHKEIEIICREVIWRLICISLGQNMTPESPQAYVQLYQPLLNEINIVPLIKSLCKLQNEWALVATASIIENHLQFNQPNQLREPYRLWCFESPRSSTDLPLNTEVIEDGVLRIYISCNTKAIGYGQSVMNEDDLCELQSVAKEKGLDVILVDLRLGFGDSHHSGVVLDDRHTELIKKCPYFVSILDFPSEASKDCYKGDTNHESDGHIPVMSVADFEIHHAGFSSPPACNRVFFFTKHDGLSHQNLDYSSTRSMTHRGSKETNIQVDDLKVSIQRKYSNIPYCNQNDLSKALLHNLCRSLQQDFQDLQIEDSADQTQLQLFQHYLSSSVVKEEDLDYIKAHVSAQLQGHHHQTLIITGGPGSGKSVLISNAIQSIMQSRIDDTWILYHFLESASSRFPTQNMNTLLWQQFNSIVSSFGHDVPLMGEEEYQEKGLKGLLNMIGELDVGHEFLFFIDGIDALWSSELETIEFLSWMQEPLPKKTCLVFSGRDSPQTQSLFQSKTFLELKIADLDQSRSERISDMFLSRHQRSRPADKVSYSDESFQMYQNPLCLKMALSFAVEFETYPDMKELTKVDPIITPVSFLCKCFVDRWHAAYPHMSSAIDETVLVFSITRIGFSERDIANYISSAVDSQFNPLHWRLFFDSFSCLLKLIDGRKHYIHAAISTGMVESLQADPESLQRVHKLYGLWLLRHGTNISDSTPEVVAEICHHLFHGGCYGAFTLYTNDSYVVRNMLESRYRKEFLEMWRFLNSNSITDCKTAYYEIMQDTSKSVDSIVELLLDMKEYSYVITHLTARLKIRADTEDSISDRIALAHCHKFLNNLEESLAHLNRCSDLVEKDKITKEKAIEVQKLKGEILFETKRFEEAERAFLRVVDEPEKKQRGRHACIENSLYGLSRVYYEQMRYKDACTSVRKLLDACTSYGKISTDLLCAAITLLVDSWIALESYQEAVLWLDEFIDSPLFVFENMHHLRFLILEKKAELFELTGNLPASCEILKQILSVHLNGEDHQQEKYISVLERIAVAEYKMKNFAAAKAGFSEVYEIRRRVHGEVHPKLLYTLEYLGCSHFQLKEYVDLEICMKRAFKIQEQTQTECSMVDESLCESIGDLLFDRGLVGIAVKMFLVCVDLNCRRDSYLNETAWKLCESVDHRLLQSNCFKEAIEFWSTLRGMFEKNLGFSHDRTLACCHQICIYTKEDADLKQPIDYTNVHSFISSMNRFAAFKDTHSSHQRSNVAEHLKKIASESRSNQRQSSDALIARKLLAFMGHSDAEACSRPSPSTLDDEKQKPANANANEAKRGIHAFTFDWSKQSPFKDQEFILHPEANQPKHHLVGHTSPINALCLVSGTGGESYLATGGVDQVIRVWDLSTMALARTLEGHTGYVYSLCAISGPHGESLLVSGGLDRSIRIWDVSAGVEIRSLEGNTAYVRSICSLVGPDGECWVATGGNDSTIRVWDIGSGRQVRSLKGKAICVRSLCSMKGPNNEIWLASAGNEKIIRIWDVMSGAVIKTLQGHTGWINTLSMVSGPEGKLLLCSGSNDRSIRVWDLAQEQQRWAFFCGSDPVTSICQVATSGGKDWLISGNHYKNMYICDMHAGTQDKILRCESIGVRHVCYSSMRGNEGYLISAGEDSVVRVWDLGMVLN